MAKNNFYAVRIGKTTGIFTSWEECKAAVEGFSGSDYKGFRAKEEAEAYLAGDNIYFDQVEKDIADGYVVAYTDGSYCEKTNAYAYGVCIFDHNLKETALCGKSYSDKYTESRNISGEIMGVLTALDWAVSNGYDKIKIYHDLESVAKWATGDFKANTPVSQFYTYQLHKRYDGIISYEFFKVPGHSNNPYNEKADILAASALRGERKIIEGANSFTVGDFVKEDLEVIIQLCIEQNSKISVERKPILGGEQIKLKIGSTSTMIKMFDNKRLLVQGKPNVIYQMLVTNISELLGEDKIVSLVSRAYRMHIDPNTVEANFDNLCPNLPIIYPSSIKSLLRQAVINLNGYFSAEEYGQYAFPALRALEGHIKYLFELNGIHVGDRMDYFDGNKTEGYTLKSKYVLAAPDNKNVEMCYTYYAKTRHKIFHFGDVMGSTDNTYLISTKKEADEIIRETLRIINNSAH